MAKPTKPAARRVSEPPRVMEASEFKAQCLELMDEVQPRQIEVHVTKHGRPVAKVAPVEAAPPTPFGFMRGTILEQGNLVAPESEVWAEGNETDPAGSRG